MSRRGKLFCFCGPAGVGKSTICQKLLAEDANMRISVSTTTRAPRGQERDGQHYHFVSEEEFERRVQADAFIEHAVFNEFRYGTERRNIEQVLEQGHDVVLDIDVQGVEQLKVCMPKDLVTIYVAPPSVEVLEQRLRARGTEEEQQIVARMEIAKREIKILSSDGFSDYTIVNDELELAFEKARQVVGSYSRL